MILKIFSDRQWKEFKEIYCWSLKQRFGMMILYFALLFMALPMILLLTIANVQEYYAKYANSTSPDQVARDFLSTLQAMLPIFVVPITLLFILIFSVMLFNYMHQKRSVDYFHSLPAGRTPLLLGKYFAGLTMIFIPLIVNFGIVAIIAGVNNFTAVVPIISILHPLLKLMLMITAMFSFTVLMAVCSGTTMDMVISSIAINITYPIMIILCQLLANSILPGLNLGSDYMTIYAVAFAPFVAAFIQFFPNYYSGDYSSFTVWWILLTLVMFAACLILYRKRKSESAENTFAFPLPKIIIRFVATTAAGLGLGLIFLTITDSSNPFNFFIGLIIGSLITHIIAQAIYSRGFKGLKKSFVYYGAFVVLFLAAYIPLSFGFFGYDTCIPATADVESISFTSDYNNILYNHAPTKVLDEKGNTILTIKKSLTSSENIENVRNLHQNLIDTYKQNGYPYKIDIVKGGGISINYHLKNGQTITRAYNSYKLIQTDKVIKLSDKISNSDEYKKSSNLIYYIEPEYIDKIQFESYSKTGSNLEPSKAVSLELIDALEKDIDAQTETKGLDYTIGVHLTMTFTDGFIPTQGSPLKKAIGSYTGKVHFNTIDYADASGYQLYIPKSFANTLALIEKYGWIK